MSRIRLRHGVFLAPYHHVEEGPTTWLHRDLELCEILEDLGFDEVWSGEHHSGGYEIISSPELFIAAAVERTKRIRFGTGVITLPFHNPLTTANRIIQLDHQARGRVSFGVGPGLLTEDMRMFGIDPNNVRNMMGERLDIILRLLKGERVTASGQDFKLVDARVHFLPYSHPLPEISVASTATPNGGRVAGQYGLSMLCFAATQSGAFDVLDTNWKIAEEVAAQYGNKVDANNLRLVAPMHVAETREKAREDVKHGLERWARYWNSIASVPLDIESDLVDYLIESGRAVIGTPADAVEMIRRLQAKQGEFGAILVQHCDWADWEQTRRSYELYARYVMPEFTPANALRKESFARAVDNSEESARLKTEAARRAFEQYEKSKLPA